MLPRQRYPAFRSVRRTVRSDATGRKKTARRDDARRRIETLLQSANDGQRHVRGMGIVFLAATLYTAITVAATTDRQLLLGGAKTLPVIGVDISLTGFFVVAPILLLLLHVALLLDITLLTRRLRALDEAIESPEADLSRDERDEHRDRLSPLLIGQVFLGRQHPTWLRLFMHVVVLVGVGFLPVLTLFETQLFYLGRHDWAMTIFHGIVVALDLLALWILRWQGHGSRSFPRSLGRLGRAMVWSVFGVEIVLSACILFAAVTVAMLPRPHLRDESGKRTVDWVDDKLQKARLSVFPFWSLDLSNELLMAKEPPPELVEATIRAAERDGRDVVVARDEAWRTHAEGANFDSRDLRDAIFWRATLRNASFKGAALSGASFGFAQLEGVDFHNARLEGAVFSFTHLDKMVFSELNLEGASFVLANLNEADFTNADLDGADFSLANIVGARFRNAELADTTFDSAVVGIGELIGEDWLEALWIKDVPFGVNPDAWNVRRRTAFDLPFVEDGTTIWVLVPADD